MEPGQIHLDAIEAEPRAGQREASQALRGEPCLPFDEEGREGQAPEEERCQRALLGPRLLLTR